MPDVPHHRRRWRDYRTAAGNRPVKEFLENLSVDDRAQVVSAMKDVELRGLDVARRLQGYDDLWEVRATGQHRIYRVLFSPEGHYRHVLLALHAFNKKTQRTPPDILRLAAERLADWRRRGEHA
jgi:phage-related protein